MRGGGYGGRGGYRGGYGGGGRGGYRGGGGRGGFRGPPRPAPEAPVRVGEVYDVDITEVGNQGDGLARVENFVIFVAGAQKGEHVKVRIRQVMRRFAVGERVTGDGGADTDEAEPPEASEEDAGGEAEGGAGDPAEGEEE